MFIVLAGMGIILGAVYTLNMIRKVFYGDTNELTANTQDIKWNEKLALGIIVLIIFGLGVYPQCLLNETTAVSESIFKKFELLLQSMQKQ